MNYDNYSNMPAPMANQSSMKYQDQMPAGVPCIDRETSINDVQLAHGYVPFQKLCPTFTPITSLKNGTIFPGLYDPKWESRHVMGGE